jgi:alanyl-tRNA synthetase
MAIHTAQHLLSAVLDTYNLPTLSWSMTQYPSLDCPYIELSRGLTWKEVEEVEEKCNQLIGEDLSVWVETSMQNEGGVDGEGDRESRGIPKDYEGVCLSLLRFRSRADNKGVIRHINIDGIDRNACCGTQVPSLSHCSSIHILPPSIPSTSTTPSKSPTRLSFTAGPRALRYLRHSSRQFSLTAQAVGCGRQDLVERATRNEELRREGADNVKGLRGELGKLVIADQVSRLDGKKIVWIKRDERTTHDFEFMGTIASGVNEYSRTRHIDITW